jgi:outer membrane protein insertion porin family
MKHSGLGRLQRLAACCSCLGAGTLVGQAPPPTPPAQTPAKPKPQNPFESVPQAPTEAPKPQAPKPGQAKPQLEGLRPAPTPDQPAEIDNVIEAIEFRGARRVPQDTLRAMILTKKGDVIDEVALQRDFMSLWNTGRFDDIILEKEPGKTGYILRFVVVERRVIRSIKYEGAKSLTVSEILDRFKERRVGLSVESQYDPNKVQRAAIVLKEYLAERGRQYATVEPELRQIPPSSMEVVFKVTEGPKVKMGDIKIEGNKVFSDRAVIRAMKNLHPIGIPHSILFENIFAKTFDSTKLEEDKQRIANFYQEKGYFTTRAGEHTLNIRDVGGTGFRFPLFYPNKPGKRADLSLTIEESRQYRLNNLNAVGMKLFRTPEAILQNVFQMKPGEIFSTAKLRKGMEQIRKLYGEFGYIDMVPEPDINPQLGSDKIDLTLNVDEGKQFFVRRIDFSGNSTTRDKVIRREILIDEGDMFSTRLWELSVLRLNQLGYFEQLKENEAAEIKRDTRTNTVDITLKVKERGKNSVQLSGGVSGIAGSFVAFGYSTNNFLGLGETLGINSQLGDRIRDVTFSFTEPYLFDKPMQAGFTIYMQRFNYDQAREVSLLSGRNLIPLFQQLGSANLLNYVTNGKGFTAFVSAPFRRTFARWSMSYGYDVSNITTLSSASQQYFQFINFQGLGGPNSLSGIRTSKVIPSFQYNTVDHPITPTRGKSLFISTTFAGSFLGGNVNLIEPTISSTYFRSGLKKGHVIGMRGLARLVAGYGGRVAPPFNRIFMGGENDIRGFNIWGISPIAFIPSESQVPVLNDDGSARLQKVLIDGQETFSPVFQTIPTSQLITPGGDTQVVTNFEYRIPIFGPVVLAAFFDAGVNRLSLKSQLKMNPERIDFLNSSNPSAGFNNQVKVAPGTEKIRTSTGLELQIMMPVVNAPFRFYWAYNPTIVQQFLQPPVVLDRSSFPNNATFFNSVATWGQATPFFELRRTFRFTISRTF